MAYIMNNTAITVYNMNSVKLQKKITNNAEVFTAGNKVTYIVDTTGTSYQEYVNYGNSVLNPTTFTPSISGWWFIGWRADKVSSSEVLSEVTMGSDPITLYATYRKLLTAGFGNGTSLGATGSTASVSAYAYYTATGTQLSPTIKLPACGYSLSGYAFNKWGLGGTLYAAGTNYTLTASCTFQASWAVKKLGVLVSKTMTGSDYLWSWKNTTKRAVTLTTQVYSYCSFPEDGYCYTYWDKSSNGSINNAATYGAFNETKKATITIPVGYYLVFFREGNVDTATIYAAEV